MKNSEIYSQKNYRKLYKNNKFLNFIRILHIHGNKVIICLFILLGYYLNNFQFSFKFQIIASFLLHFHWDIFDECIINYYEKKMLNKNYKLGELEFLSPDFQNDEIQLSLNCRILSYLKYIIPSLISFILLKNKNKLISILFSLTFILHLKKLIELYFYFKKYNPYGDKI